MPTYQYSCTQCGHFLEVVQSFSDDSLTVCPECSGRLRKVFGAVGVVFKGSGFYRTDSRGPDTKSSSDSSTSSAKEGSSSATKESSSTSSSSTKEGSTGSGSSSSSASKASTGGGTSSS